MLLICRLVREIKSVRVRPGTYILRFSTFTLQHRLRPSSLASRFQENVFRPRKYASIRQTGSPRSYDGQFDPLAAARSGLAASHRHERTGVTI